MDNLEITDKNKPSHFLTHQGQILSANQFLNFAPVTLNPRTDAFIGTGLKIFSSDNSELNNEIQNLKSKIKDLEKDRYDGKKNHEKICELLAANKELSDKIRLRHLYEKIHPLAYRKASEDTNFLSQFETGKRHSCAVMSIDIRNSTELMLNAKNSSKYSEFITKLIDSLRDAVLSYYGFYDKFTGDGILCFFPDFYSGDDALLFSLQVSRECHNIFNKVYLESRNCFDKVRSDIGLGIGIDYGASSLESISGDMTFIGHHVVYACRLSSAPHGHTYLNQGAFYKLQEYEKNKRLFLEFTETEIDCKNQGKMVAYEYEIEGKVFNKLSPPSWATKADC